MILPAGPATGNRTCILEKKRQQGFSGEVQGWRRRIMHVEWRTHARCLRGQLFPVVVKELIVLPISFVNDCRHAFAQGENSNSWQNQLFQFKEWKPAIHLDNRYRLMRHEPMLDADGNVTDVLGEDDCN
ncbi:hypothetical protein ALC62_03795 [Cyphomyrmex costatus]|uniref:Uncharacterized protein n=1 Tax=Cyphomyrmex costatus TaxID=456900 RepID=A0A151IKY7_9HYME|nr:hypothetical protein ALC62_03795 [Cyphomyrmex costatus]